MMNKKRWGILGLVVLTVIAGVLVYRDTNISKIEITGDAADALKEYGIKVSGDAKVEMVPVDQVPLPAQPSLEREVSAPVSMDPLIVKNFKDKVATTIATLKANPKDQSAWIALGGLRKVLGDYEGARDAWEYAKALAPNDIVAWNNLGDLYHFYLKDFQKSELNWKKTIEIKSDYIAGYRGLYELYLYSMAPHVNEIERVLKEGIAKNPGATELKVLLDEYQKSAK